MAGLAGVVPHLAADLVERVGGGLHDVKGVHTERGVRAALGDRPGDPRRHVGRHQFDVFAALLAELVEEALDGLAVAAAGRPRDCPTNCVWAVVGLVVGG